MTDLEALVVAAYVFVGEYSAPSRAGRRPLTSDAELVALAFAPAAIGISSDRQFLGLIGRVLPGWFPHLPDQSQYNRRLRALVELISIVQQRLARLLDSGGVRLSAGTLIGVANYPRSRSAPARRSRRRRARRRRVVPRARRSPRYRRRDGSRAGSSQRSRSRARAARPSTL